MNSKYIIDAMEDEFIPYAGEILLNNLPSVADGLLPVNRKVLWALDKNGITPDKSFIKLLRAGAYTMVYYVFGDIPLYKAMKNMANNNINNFYLEPKGSFGDKRKKDGVGASPRYIECKLSKYGKDLLYNIRKNNVEFKRNFDNTEDEPITLPSIIPNVLTNSSQSIAVGEASKMPSHNINDVCDSIINYINTNNIDKSIEILKCPDFSLGGQIPYDKETFDKIYRTGKGSFTILGKYKFDEKKNKITIYEVPYETYIEDIENKLETSIEKGLFKEVTDYHNASDKDGIALDIYLKKSTNIQTFITKLRKYTSYESKFACNFTLIDLDNKTPLLMSLEDIITKWIKHRQICIINEYLYDIAEKGKLLHRLYGLQILNKDLDKAIEIIRSSKKENIAIEKLVKYFNLTTEQADYIATIRLININKEWIFNKINNIKILEDNIQQLTNEKNDIDFINNLIISQLEEVKKKYGKPRQTEIIYEDTLQEISSDDLIEDGLVTMVYTKENYTKKTRKYSEQQTVKDGDLVQVLIQCSNKDKVMYITDKGNLYFLNIWEMNDKLPSKLGDYLPSILPLETNETVLGMITTNNFVGHVLIAFSDGHAVKIPMESYRTKTNRTKLSNCLSDCGKPILITQIEEDCDIELTNSFGKTVTINTKDISEKKSRSSNGITVMSSKRKGFEVIKAIKL